MSAHVMCVCVFRAHIFMTCVYVIGVFVSMLVCVYTCVKNMNEDEHVMYMSVALCFSVVCTAVQE